jgi:hypothetical protein
MKKIIILLSVFMFLSCSKEDENGEKELAIKVENMRGKWYFKETRKADGTSIPYDNACPNNRDYVVFYEGGIFKFYDHQYSCDNPEVENGNFIYYQDGVTVNFGSTVAPLPNSPCIINRITTQQINFEFDDIFAPTTEKRILVLTRS